MVKRIGDIDKVPFRKRRSDIGKKRKKYRGVECRHRPKKKYIRKIGNKESLWHRAYWRVPMSRDGAKNIKKNRNKMVKEVTKMKMSPVFRDVPLDEINTEEKFLDFFARNLWEDPKLGGKFVIMRGSNAKTKTGFKPVAVAVIQVKQTPEGNIAKLIKSIRLHRYKWFYKG